MNGKPRVLVSACLLGTACRYDGGSKPVEGIAELLPLAELIPVCPEQLGGLPTPREPSERRDGRVVSRAGADVTGAFARGAAESVQLAGFFGAKVALLKARSPSCGGREIYDGSFTGRIVPGRGVAAAALAESGLTLYDETQLNALIDALKGRTR